MEKCEGGYRELNKEEVFKKYNDLEQYTVEDLFTKYLPVNEKGNKPEIEI